jgi:hypothetical protein
VPAASRPCPRFPSGCSSCLPVLNFLASRESAAIQTQLEIASAVGTGQDGELDVEQALGELARLPYSDLGFARVELHRELRQGAPEAVLAGGKTPAQVVAIAQALSRRLIRHASRLGP